jgi:hypothetical protein
MAVPDITPAPDVAIHLSKTTVFYESLMKKNTDM